MYRIFNDFLGECKTEEGCEIVKVRDKRASAYRTLDTEKEKEVVQQKEYVAEYKNRDIEVILENYILRRWRRDIIPPALRRNKNKYGEKNETIEKLTNEANYVVDECLFLLSKDEGMLATFVEQLKTIKQEVQVQVPKPPSQKTGDVIEDIYAVEKPQQNDVNDPQWLGEQGTTTAAATEQATTTATAEQGEIIAAATEQATTTAIVSEEATNTS
ncbi:hypothetical protein Tco_0624469 [Tanacetum coccineum]|uniref:Uncharacterized protein n=1 Tax=Tanacetum coccineum TaxID=301880 RepID=A0ABQ4WDZ8_9ASTR